MGKDGEGIGHIDGLTVFVKGSVVGDRALVKMMKVKKNLAYARLMEVQEASPWRVMPVCEKASACGGCTLQHITYEKQLELLQSHVKNCLVRIGGVEDAEAIMEPIIGMRSGTESEMESGMESGIKTPMPCYFRNKMQFPVGLDREGRPALGFYAGHTHALIPLTDCPTGHPVNRDILQAVREYLTEAEVAVYNEEQHTGLVRHVLTRVGFYTGQVMVCIVINGNKLPEQELLIRKLQEAVETCNKHTSDMTGAKEQDKQDECGTAYTTGFADSDVNLELTSVAISINREKTNRILGDHSKVIFGKEYIEDRIGDLTFRIAPESFYQVNPVQTRKLYAKALDFAGLTGEETVWDMYCGIGTISLFLAKKAKQVYGVEIVPQAIDNAKENAKLNQITNAEFFVGKAEEVVPKLYSEKPDRYRADVVVVDPPRKGCDAALLSTIAAMAPKRLVYVSCDPATLARDISILKKEGFAVEKVAAVDMFPHTMHVETICLLGNKSKRPDDRIQVRVDADQIFDILEREKEEKLRQSD
ncbi:MAG: 23S rRNA (uracil(1939)-C(5))-methyltransferase RlmD [Eubacterium sp.]|nr:23S rRNA (uracil(1939)-C(5))-methyltransferase RlmD [Eubacterium sp.]